MKNKEILEKLLRDFHGAIAHPKIARAVLFARSHFRDAFQAEIVWELLVHEGQWKAAIRALPYSFQKANAIRIRKFEIWAEKITRREVRGLLEWKGGAL